MIMDLYGCLWMFVNVYGCHCMLLDAFFGPFAAARGKKIRIRA
jgi:hypothetical protein